MRYINLIKNLANWQTYLAVKFGFNKEDPILLRTRAGIRFEVPRRLLHTFKEIFMDEDYMTGLGRPVPDGATIIDVGANAGYFSMFAASRFRNSRVFSFEPIPVNFEQLQKNISFNKDSRITGIQKAVYKESGEISLSYDPSDSFTTSATIFEKDQEPESIQVATTSL
ncbi:MAG: FkbM family methyltransferase, partial [Planctomycetota bacterium]|nr:FkbM family methyltransferase [Planctomycetota bacterium]